MFKGLGFAAGYLGGIAKAETFFEIIDLAESYGEDDWREFLKEIQYAQPDEFFFFEHDPETGLSAPDRINPQYLESLKIAADARSEVTLNYRLSRWVHDVAFTRGKGLYSLLASVFARWDKKPGLLEPALLLAGERGQAPGLRLPGLRRLQPARLRLPLPHGLAARSTRATAPAAARPADKCELLDKECFWARVYERLKYYGESETMFDGPVILYDAQLKHTSAWANTYLDRDHFGRQQQPPKPPAPGTNQG